MSAVCLWTSMSTINKHGGQKQESNTLKATTTTTTTAFYHARLLTLQSFLWPSSAIERVVEMKAMFTQRWVRVQECAGNPSTRSHPFTCLRGPTPQRRQDRKTRTKRGAVSPEDHLTVSVCLCFYWVTSILYTLSILSRVPVTVTTSLRIHYVYN